MGITYTTQTATLSFWIPADIDTYATTDYARLHTNGGDAGAIDWATPATKSRIALDDAYYINLYGWGAVSYQGGSTGWGAGEWGVAYWKPTLDYIITSSGEWKFAFGTYDYLGNLTQTSLGVATATVELVPTEPSAMIVKSYSSCALTLYL